MLPLLIVLAQTPARLTPVDESAKDPTLKTFLSRLRKVVTAKDTAGLVALADPKVRTSFGEAGGVADLRRRAAEGELWPELAEVVGFGGKFRDGMFWMPYVYAAWPDRFDAFEYMAVVARGVPLREKPMPNARVAAKLSYDIVRLVGAKDVPGWRQVAVPKGPRGWVNEKLLRSPVGYRLGLEKVRGNWRIAAFVSGD